MWYSAIVVVVCRQAEAKNRLVTSVAATFLVVIDCASVVRVAQTDAVSSTSALSVAGS